MPRVLTYHGEYSDSDIGLEAEIGSSWTELTQCKENRPLEIVLVQPPHAENRVTNSVDGKVALVDRGVCPFVEKAVHMQKAGAIAMICVNNETRSPNKDLIITDCGYPDLAAEITIPVTCINYNKGNQFKSDLTSDTCNVTVKNN